MMILCVTFQGVLLYLPLTVYFFSMSTPHCRNCDQNMILKYTHRKGVSRRVFAFSCTILNTCTHTHKAGKRRTMNKPIAKMNETCNDVECDMSLRALRMDVCIRCTTGCFPCAAKAYQVVREAGRIALGESSACDAEQVNGRFLHELSAQILHIRFCNACWGAFMVQMASMRRSTQGSF